MLHYFQPCPIVLHVARGSAMEDIDPDQEAIMEIVEPYLPRMFSLFGKAVTFFNAMGADHRARLNNRAIADDISCFIWHEWRAEFLGETGFHFLKIGTMEVLNLHDKLLIRLKKVDANGRHRNHDSAQQRDFDGQRPLPGLPPEAARTVMGYQPDVAFSKVLRVTLRRPNGTWVSQIVEPENGKTWIDITRPQLRFDRGQRAAGA